VTRLSDLNQRVSALKKQLEETDTASRVDIERRIKLTEQKIVSIEESIESLERRIADPSAFEDAAVEEDDWTAEEWESWDEAWEDEDFQADWGDGEYNDDDDAQFSFKPQIYRKYPGSFGGVFPVDTRLGETIFRYNRVEGVYIGLAQPKRLYWHSKPRVVGAGSIGYGFANHRWRYGLGLYLPLYFSDMILEFGGEGHSFTDSKDQWTVNRDENTFAALLASEDYMDYFSREGFSASVAWHYRGPESLYLRASGAYVHDTYDNMGRRTDWSVFGGNKKFRPQPLINPGNLNSIVFSAAISTTPHVSRELHGWHAQASFESAGGFAGGDSEFRQLIIDIRRFQPVIPYVNVNVRARAGVSDGLLPLQRSLDLGGVGTLPGYRHKEFSGTQAALFNLEFIFRNPVFEDARGWAAELLGGLNLIAFYDAGITDAVDPARILNSSGHMNGAVDAALGYSFLEGRWHSDIGVAVGSADGDTRIGVAWPLTHTGLSNGPRFILRLARPF